MNNVFSRFRLEDNLLLGTFINTQYSFEGFGIDGMAPGVQIHENQYASKMGTRYVMPFCLVSSLVYSLFQHFCLSNRCHIYIYIHHHIRILIFFTWSDVGYVKTPRKSQQAVISLTVSVRWIFLKT
jgi:hypothetical protein